MEQFSSFISRDNRYRSIVDRFPLFFYIRHGNLLSIDVHISNAFGNQALAPGKQIIIAFDFRVVIDSLPICHEVIFDQAHESFIQSSFSDGFCFRLGSGDAFTDHRGFFVHHTHLSSDPFDPERIEDIEIIFFHFLEIYI